MEFCLAQKLFLHLLLGNTYKLMKTGYARCDSPGQATYHLVELDLNKVLAVEVVRVIVFQVICSVFQMII